MAVSREAAALLETVKSPASMPSLAMSSMVTPAPEVSDTPPNDPALTLPMFSADPTGV